ncbi:hypothetical protein TH468_11375 [Thalassospira sp. MCCC 1A03138]|nr:hypothetical protein TH468_11375 [Thalassospira sp. MCCC 1A03138]
MSIFSKTNWQYCGSRPVFLQAIIAPQTSYIKHQNCHRSSDPDQESGSGQGVIWSNPDKKVALMANHYSGFGFFLRSEWPTCAVFCQTDLRLFNLKSESRRRLVAPVGEA